VKNIELNYKENTIPKFELKEEKEIEKINWIKIGNCEYTHIYNFHQVLLKKLEKMEKFNK
jgi:hypothetical protein